jgi:hypothetical protein
MSEQTKKAALLIIVIVAIVVAIWSGMSAFGNRENVVGNRGDLSKGKGKPGEDLPPQPGGARFEAEGKAGEFSGSSSASGAPAGMGGGGGGGGSMSGGGEGR